MPGSIPITIPAPLVDYEGLDVTWPIPAPNATGGAAFNVSGQSKYGNNMALPVWSGAGGGATNNMGVYHGIYGGQWTSGGAAVSGRSAYQIPLYLPLTKNALPATFLFGDWMRVFRIQCLFATVGVVNYTTASGLTIVPMAGVSPGFLSAGNPGFGILGNGAGGWQFNASVAAGLTDTTALVWPAAVTEWVLVDFEFLAATGASDAIFNLYLNGTQVALPASCSHWGAGTHLPDYATLPNSAGFVLAVGCGDGALAGQLNLAACRWMIGRYRVNGAQI